MSTLDTELFVGGLDYNTMKETIVEYFSSFGEIYRCNLPLHPDSGQSRGYGFLTFKEPGVVDEVLRRSPHVIDTRRVEVRRSYGKTVDRNRSHRVFIGGIRDSHTREGLEQFFSQYGRVLDVEVFTDRYTGKCRGFAFILFEEYSVVDRVLAQRMFTILSHTCEAKPAISSNRDRNHRERRCRPSRNQGTDTSTSFEKMRNQPLFAFFQNTPPSVVTQPFYGEAPPSLPLCTAPLHHQSVVLPPFQYIDPTGEQPVIAPAIYQEFPDGVIYESHYYAS